MFKTAPKFWYRKTPTARVLGAMLGPLGELYGEAAQTRLSAPYRWRPPIPVLCVGNATVGGAGKTPTARFMRGLLGTIYKSPAVLLRGFGGAYEHAMVVQDSGAVASEVGDEAMLHARDGLTVVSSDRVLGARLALFEHADVIIMDDGLQNRDIAQDVRILVVPIDTGFGNERCAPAGPLRAPLEFTLRHADMIVAVGNPLKGGWVRAVGDRYDLPVFFAETRLSGYTADVLTKPVIAYAGTAFPKRFFDGIKEAGLKVTHTYVLGDHEVPSEAKCAEIIKRAANEGAALVTTEKDLARLRGLKGSAATLYLRSTALKYAINFPDQEEFLTWIRATIAVSRNAYMPPEHQHTLPAGPSTSSEDRLVESADS